MIIHSRSITVAALGLLGACGSAMNNAPIVFNCDSFNKGQTYRVRLSPDSNHVDVMWGVQPYQYTEEPMSPEKVQQGWRRWVTNADRKGKANSWTELNTKSGALRHIGINGQVDSLGRCLQQK